MVLVIVRVCSVVARRVARIIFVGGGGGGGGGGWGWGVRISRTGTK